MARLLALVDATAEDQPDLVTKREAEAARASQDVFTTEEEWVEAARKDLGT